MNDTTTTQALAKQRLEELITFFGANVEAEARDTPDGLELEIMAADIAPRLIGHRGETLRAIEYLVNQMVRHADPDAPRVLVDIAGYRQARRSSLEDLAREVADRVVTSGQEEELKPMNPAERRIVHMALRDLDTVDTESRGEGRSRRIVVIPRS